MKLRHKIRRKNIIHFEISLGRGLQEEGFTEFFLWLADFIFR